MPENEYYDNCNVAALYEVTQFSVKMLVNKKRSESTSFWNKW